MPTRREVSGAFRHAEANPVVCHFQFDFLVKTDVQRGVLCLCMMDNVIQCFLRDAIEGQFNFTGYTTFLPCYKNRYAHRL